MSDLGIYTIQIKTMDQRRKFWEFAHAEGITVDSHFTDQQWEWVLKMAELSKDSLRTSEKLKKLSKELDSMTISTAQGDLNL